MKILKPPMRTIVLLAVILLAAGAFAVYKFLPKPILSVKDVNEKTDTYINKKVTVIGKAEKSIACTAMACAADNACCNSCGGNITLVDTNDPSFSVTLIGARESDFVCSGNECNVQCNSNLEQGKEYLVTGILQGESFEGDGGKTTWFPKLKYESHKEVGKGQ